MLAIILSRKDFREYDQIISVYTAVEGRLDLLAKGVKKITSKNSGNLFLGSFLEIDIAKGREIDRLIRVNPVEIWKNIRQDLNKQLLVGGTLNLTCKLIKPELVDENIFIWLKTWLSFVNNSNVTNRNLFYSYIVVLTALLGFRPELDECYSCGLEQQKNRFDIMGGLICNICSVKASQSENLHNISLEEIGLYKILLSGSLESVDKTKISSNLQKIIKQFTEYHTEIKLTTN